MSRKYEWSKYEDGFIIANKNKMTRMELAQHLNLTYNQVGHRIDVLSLATKMPPIWTDDEIEFLKNNILKMTIDEISKELDRGQGGVSYQIKRLGLSKNVWTDENLNRVLDAKTLEECFQLCEDFNLGISRIQDIREKHGIKRFREYKIWQEIIRRCENVECQSFKNYGGRGITICKEWRDDFWSFYNWAKNNSYKDILQIDRIDNDGNYCPENCRWVDRKTNCRNKRNNRLITAWGETKTFTDWIEDPRCIISKTSLKRRLKSCPSTSPEILMKINRKQFTKLLKELKNGSK